MNNSVWEKQRKRLFELIEIGSNYDAWCWGDDFFNTFTMRSESDSQHHVHLREYGNEIRPAPSDAGAPDGCFLCY